tara:strand:- start:22383 stop:22775 length:393 start_codon:yes stop_codon:yes gene_type:complete
MQQILIGLLLALGLSTYWLYSENETLKGNNIKLEAAVEEQKQTMEAMKESFEKQGKALNNLTRKNAAIEAEKEKYLDIFRRHDLNKLAIAKPGLIEIRSNRETKEVFETIENDTKIIDELDDIKSGDSTE